MKYTVELRNHEEFSVDAAELRFVEGTPSSYLLRSSSGQHVAGFPADNVKRITADEVTTKVKEASAGVY